VADTAVIEVPELDPRGHHGQWTRCCRSSFILVEGKFSRTWPIGRMAGGAPAVSILCGVTASGHIWTRV
jgi:hypothetical protein